MAFTRSFATIDALTRLSTLGRLASDIRGSAAKGAFPAAIDDN